MRNTRVLLVGLIASVLLLTLSVSCDAEQNGDIQGIEQQSADRQALGKDEIDNDDI